jgi:DNA mismatch repair protein MutL
MNRIRLLPEQVANQIAAGEVVERPASVIKELVENALDAQPGRITVEIQAGGRSLMRVTDDGVGMNKDDALLCLERHATSKIRRAEDLQAISTMGFRGEALPSIASVCRFTLTTRERESQAPEATRVTVNGGKLTEVAVASGPPGTAVEVRQLFFNLPARRKFLRSEETEAAHIHHYLTLAALAHPHIAFNFVRDGRMAFQLPSLRQEDPSLALRERLRSLYGAELNLVAVDARGELHENFETFNQAEAPEAGGYEQSPIRLWGFIGAPGVSRSTRDDHHLFVNRRPVENRTLNHSLMEGYHTALMKGRYPVCCLFLEINPAAVDVNIHPSKREIKFRQERPVRHFVTQAVRQALLRYHGETLPEPPPPEPAVPTSPEPEPLQLSLAGPDQPPLAVVAQPLFQTAPVAPPTTPAPAQSAAAPPPQTPDPTPSPAPTTPRPAPSPAPYEPVPLLQVPLRVVGVVGNLYVVLESDRGLVLLDQHAAHERILFEQTLDRLERGDAPAQRLLLPETLELAVRDADFLKRILPFLVRMGVGLREFGDRTFLLEALPPFVKARDPRAFVLGIIDDLKAAGTEVNSMRLGEHTVAKTVCRHSVKANDPLTLPELENLVQDLRRCSMPYTCPHGRPTLIEMNYRELERKFGRQQ